MTLITRRDVIAHQSVVPWPTLIQVEQDLLLCRAMIALFDDAFLRSQIAMRGGTLLHKVYLAPPSRYSEDIDLVVVGERPERHIRLALRRVLKSVLGTPRLSAWEEIKLAIRNSVKPSRVLRMTYAVPSLIETGRTLEIVVEANVTERTSHRPVVKMPFEFSARLFCVGLRWEWHHLQPHCRRNHPGPFPRPDKSRCPPVPFRSLMVLAWRSETGDRSKLIQICA
jgi:hypothetical protein